MKVNKNFFGNTSLEGSTLWLCNHDTKNPKPLKKNYAVAMSIPCWTHSDQYGERTNATVLLMPFYCGDSYISDGREEEHK